MSTRPDWADAEVLRACRPELHVRCERPACRAFAVYELEFDRDGEREAHRVCPDHRAEIGTDDR